MNKKTYQLLIGLGAYFCLQLAARVATSPSSHLDESEQLLLTQSLQWGYGPQPPLYTWLQWAVFQVTGPTVFGLSLLKNFLLFTICTLAFSISRTTTGTVRGGMIGALALVFIPDLVWEAQRDLTHSVLASLFMLATIWGLLRTQKDGHWPNYLLLGTILGFGCLSKYNYCVGMAGVLIGALTLPEGRRLILSRRFAGTLLVAVVVITPHALWGVGHQGLALASIGKLKLVSQQAKPGAGIAKAMLLSLGMVAPVLAIFCLSSFRSRRRPTQDANPFAAQLLVRQVAFTILLVMLGMLVSGASNIRSRWLLPMLVTAPIMCTAVFWPWLNDFREKCLIKLALVIAIVVAVLLPARIVFAERLGRLEPLHYPYSKLALTTTCQCGSNTLVLAQNPCVAGNVRLAAPTCNVISPEVWRVLPHPGTNLVLFVWDATKNGVLGQEQIEALNSCGLCPAEKPQFFEACYHHHTKRMFKLGMVRTEEKPPHSQKKPN